MNEQDNQQPSSLQRRVWTCVLDFFFVGAFAVVIGTTIWGEDAKETIYIQEGLFAVYFLFKDSYAGKSLGKAMTRIYVVDADTREPIGPLKSMYRNWVFLIPFFPVVELIVAICRKDKRRLGDLMANTIVVRE